MATTYASECGNTKKEGDRSWKCQLPRQHKGTWHISYSGHRRWPVSKERRAEEAEELPPPSYLPHVILDGEDLRETVKAYEAFDYFVFDTETIGTREPREGSGKKDLPALDERTNRAIWIALSGPGRVDIVPMGHPSIEDNPAPEQLSLSEVLTELRPLFFSDRRKVAANVIFDTLTLAKHWGGIPPGPYGDLAVLVQLLDENLRDYDLGSIVTKYLGYGYRKLGREGAMDSFPFWDVARYVGYDAKLAHLVWISRQARLARYPKLQTLFDLECDITEVLIHAKDRGTMVDREALQTLDEHLEGEIAKLSEDIYAAAGQKFLITSTQQRAKLLYGKPEEGGLGLKATVKTNTGANSTSEEALTKLLRKHPVVPLLVKHSDLSKLRSTYCSGFLPHIHPDGRIRGRLNQRGAATGRFTSCVSGETILVTSRGAFRFDEYLPQEGDTVPTHWGSWQRVLRKIYKGRSLMYRVQLSNGSVLSCTAAHRLLTPEGWRAVGSLSPGDTVRSYVGLSELRQQPAERGSRSEHLPGAGSPDPGGDRQESGDHLSERAVDSHAPSAGGEGQSRESSALLTLQDWSQEPDEGQEWFPTPQLQGRHTGRPWLLDAEGGRGVRAGASAGDGRDAGLGDAARLVGGASHRRGQDQQQPGQSGVGHLYRAPDAPYPVAWEDAQIAEIHSLGAMGVWDIEVEGAHSYLTQGFVNHNSGPNLQNIPRQGDEDDAEKKIRSMFVAPPGYVLVVGDFGQIEYRVMGHFAAPFVKESRILRAFLDDIDLHAMTAGGLYNLPPSEVTKEQRQAGKTCNFLLMFGGGYTRIMESGLAREKTKAKGIYEQFHRTYPEVKKFTEATVRACRTMKTPYVETLWGRRRRLPMIKIPANNEEMAGHRMYAERQAVNHKIQGTAADINKSAMVRAHRRIDRYGYRGQMHIILTVHDEIIMEVPERLADDGVALLKEAMEGVKVDLRAPLVADVHAAETWSEAK